MLVYTYTEKRKLRKKTDKKYKFSSTWFGNEKEKERKWVENQRKSYRPIFSPKLARKWMENMAVHFLKNKIY